MPLSVASGLRSCHYLPLVSEPIHATLQSPFIVFLAIACPSPPG